MISVENVGVGTYLGLQSKNWSFSQSASDVVIIIKIKETVEEVIKNTFTKISLIFIIFGNLNISLKKSIKVDNK